MWVDGLSCFDETAVMPALLVDDAANGGFAAKPMEVNKSSSCIFFIGFFLVIKEDDDDGEDFRTPNDVMGIAEEVNWLRLPTVAKVPMAPCALEYTGGDALLGN